MNKNSEIASFFWNEFPVENDKFLISICTKNENTDKEKMEINKLLNFIKIIFPEDFKEYNEIEDLLPQKNKSTVLIDFSKQKSDWLNKLYIFQNYAHNKGHFIMFGNYDNIPNIVLTISDIIIFDCEETANKYLGKNCHININNFNNNDYFILLDKRRMKSNIFGYLKSK